MTTVKELIEPVIHGGAIVLCLYVLFWAWKTTRDEKKITEMRLKFLKTIMVFSILILIISGAIEIAKRVLDHKSLVEAYQISMHDIGLNAFLGAIFEPQRTHEKDNYCYAGRAPNGFLREVCTNPIFQDFSTNHMVQRLWADPRKKGSFIKAIKEDKDGNALSVTFIRKGWGCDISIKQKDNMTAFTENFNKIVIQLQADNECIKSLKAAGTDSLGFRLRLVDGRNNHWSWGKTDDVKGVVSAHYLTTDSMNRELSLKDGEVHSFEFDINNRKNWAIFKSDGGIAPIQSPDCRFKFISMVILEPGIIPKKGIVPYFEEDPYKHKRFLSDSPINAASGLPIEGRLFIKKIYFE